MLVEVEHLKDADRRSLEIPWLQHRRIRITDIQTSLCQTAASGDKVFGEEEAELLL